MQKEPEPEPEPREPGGRNTHKPDEMTSEDLAAAYGHAARLRAHEVEYQLDLWLGTWMEAVRRLLAKRGHLDELRARADAGDRSAASALVDLLAERGDLDELGARADAGQLIAAWRLAGLLAERGDLDGLRVRADDGGGFAVNGGGLPTGEPGEVCYLAPDTLQWERCEMGHSVWVRWTLYGPLDTFYEDARWPGWRETASALSPGQGIAAYPPPSAAQERLTVLVGRLRQLTELQVMQLNQRRLQTDVSVLASIDEVIALVRRRYMSPVLLPVMARTGGRATRWK